MAPRAYIALVSAVIVVLGAGFPLTFSLYTTSFQSVLNLSQKEINAINVANIIGQFIGYPVLGYCSDHYGAHLVAFLGAFSSIPGLFVAANAYDARSSYVILSAAFFWIGVGSTCGYITAMSTCVRSLPRAKGLAISLATCSYGSATLIYSVVFQAFFKTSEGYDIPKFWRSITVFVAAASIVGFFGMRLPNSSDLACSEGDDVTTAATTAATSEEEQETRPLLDNPATRNEHVTSSNPSFFKDVSVLLYALGYVLIAGATETLVGNMGSVMAALSASSQASTAVSLFAFFSTISRILVGSSLDLLARHGYSRFHIPIFIVALPMCLVFLVLGLAPMTPASSLVMLGINGFCYGSMYCSGPVIAAEVWGVEQFGRNWGVLSYSPLLGSVLLSLLYAFMYDNQADRQNNDGNLCIGQSCFGPPLLIMSVCIAVGLGSWVCAWQVWRRRGLHI